MIVDGDNILPLSLFCSERANINFSDTPMPKGMGVSEREARVISYDWDAVAEKYNSIELGTAKESLVSYVKGGSYVPSI